MGLKEFVEFLTFGSPIILSFGLLLGIWNYKGLGSISKVLLSYIFVALLTDILSRVAATYLGNNLFLIPMFGFFELLFFTIIYLKLFRIKIFKVWPLILISTICFNIYETYISTQLDPSMFNSYSRVFDAVCIVLMAIVFYFENLSRDKRSNINFLKLNTVIFIFYSLNLIFFLTSNFLINIDSDIKFYFWMFNLGLTIIFYLLLIHWIWKHGRIPIR